MADMSWVEELDRSSSLTNLLAAIDDNDDSDPFAVSSSPIARGRASSPAAARIALGNRSMNSPRVSNENERSSPQTDTVIRRTRRRRQLPSTKSRSASACNLTRSNSLCFLGSPDNRKRLPEVGQGKLLKQVSDRLDVEAQLRLQVVKELKEEKHQRWKLEDDVKELEAKLDELRQQFDAKLSEIESLHSELEEERQRRSQAEAEVQAKVKEVEHSKRHVDDMHTRLRQCEQDLAESEALAKQSFEASIRERQQREEVEDKFHRLVELIESHQQGASTVLLAQIDAETAGLSEQLI